MKVAFVAPAFPSAADPITGIYHRHRAAAVAGLAEVAVFCLAPARGLRPSEPRAETLPPEQPADRPLAVTRLRYPSLPVLTRGLNAALAEPVLRAALRAFAPDVVLSYWLYPEGLAATRAAHRLGVRAVAGAIGSDLRLAESGAARRRVRRALFEADHVVTVSEELRSRAIALGLGPARVTTVRNGCDGAVFHPAPRDAARRELGVAPDAQLVVFAGRLVATKGLRELLTAVAALAPGRPSLQLAMLGDGPLLGEMRAFVAGRGLERAVRFAGPLPSPAVATWLAASNLLCLPSYSEGCPNVVLEALSCGRPVVATRVGGIPELVDDDCALLVPPGDPDRLQEALATALGRAWHFQARPRSWSDVGAELHRLCQAALAS